ncbi:UDP-2,4-diacetamido-2,4,6-trideoxy-beta-L-altropyranose hydrolase [Novipirellula aureliae]|uniref:UDP-2,4-diacetamido-2,4, 6-trideoxy-beta-L-altropyranose hydrolase n=1 Tax=Novipirellula aureliae TaxID=2527966 RepID=A0A5C6DP60_9BACT|nr:UDP-2,4-diacetamido-2,4,6-trideoxy-beta-L-altropyranose hydrolase [Novipirellula aureliae]TWU37667.1 UDP-2,4-diacetamido-2,4,6-trideoxy-beta-L-altropyranose hydrolase [Novipirellula aureliae]
MRLLIRADASATIGAGHVMRCLALAQAWQDAGGDVTFVSATLSESLGKRIESEGFELVRTQTIAGSPDDSLQLQKLAKDLDVTAIVIDGYLFGVAYHAALTKLGRTTLAIDDDGHLAEYCTDFVLNQNLGATSSLYADVSPNTRLLLGTRFALLRREFRSFEPRQKEQHNHNRILVTLGAADPDNVLETVVNGLRQLSDRSLRFRVLTGTLNDRHDSLVSLVSGDARFEFIGHVEQMSEMYAWADFAIAAGGSTNWEMCRYGLPRILIVLADNQIGVVQELSHQGIAVNLGSTSDVLPGSVSDAVRRLIEDHEFLDRARKNSEFLVDGQGATRVVDELRRVNRERNEIDGAKSLLLREATLNDWKLLLEWRNDIETREASLNQHSISESEHKAWLNKYLSDPENHLWIAEVNGEPVGTVRLDQGEPRELSWTVAPDARGQGIGRSMVQTVLLTMRSAVHAIARTNNIASCRIARSVGFHVTRSDDEWTEFFYVPKANKND